MPQSSPITVVSKDGLRGVILEPLPRSLDEVARVQMEDGTLVEVPASVLRQRSDGSYDLPVGHGDVVEKIPVLAEELDVQKRAVTTGGVRVSRRVLEHEETVELPLLKEHVDVKRVVVQQEVDGPLPVRREGDTTIIPIVEEVLVLEKRYRLTEEIHVTRTLHEEMHRERVTLYRQDAEIEYLGEEPGSRDSARARPPQK